MKRRPLLFMSVVALGIGMVTSVGIMNAPSACAAEEHGQFQGRHSSAFEMALRLVPRSGRRRL